MKGQRDLRNFSPEGREPVHQLKQNGNSDFRLL